MTPMLPCSPYTGSGNPSTNGNLTGHSFGQLSANGWSVIGSYGDLAGQ